MRLSSRNSVSKKATPKDRLAASISPRETLVSEARGTPRPTAPRELQAHVPILIGWPVDARNGASRRTLQSVTPVISKAQAFAQK